MNAQSFSVMIGTGIAMILCIGCSNASREGRQIASPVVGKSNLSPTGNNKPPYGKWVPFTKAQANDVAWGQRIGAVYISSIDGHMYKANTSGGWDQIRDNGESPCFAVADDGNLWFANNDGGKGNLYWYNGGWTKIATMDGNIKDIAVGSDGRVWFTVSGALLNRLNGIWWFKHGNATPTSHITTTPDCLTVSGDSPIILDGGRARFWDGTRWSPILPSDPDRSLKRIACNHEGYTWAITSDDKLAMIEPGDAGGRGWQVLNDPRAKRITVAANGFAMHIGGDLRIYQLGD